jgi:cytochrome c
MDLRSRRLAPALFGSLAFVIIATSPCTARASSDDDDDLDVPEEAYVCLSCHAFRPDEPELEGPSLWGVVGRPVASVEGYEYSGALAAKGGTWTRERLDRWIAGPAAVTPGTKMTLGGVRNAADRKVVLDFLETLKEGSDSPAKAAD